MLPHSIDVVPLALQGGSLQGTLPVAMMTRLLPLLHEEGGEISAKLSFVRSPQSHLLMTGSLETKLTLICQRCMEPMELPVQLTLSNVVLSSIEEAERFEDERYEPVIAQGGSLDLWAALEDEIILSLSVFPKHAEGEVCNVSQELAASLQPAAEEEALDEDEQKRENPFAVLRQLL